LRTGPWDISACQQISGPGRPAQRSQCGAVGVDRKKPGRGRPIPEPGPVLRLPGPAARRLSATWVRGDSARQISGGVWTAAERWVSSARRRRGNGGEGRIWCHVLQRNRKPRSQIDKATAWLAGIEAGSTGWATPSRSSLAARRARRKCSRCRAGFQSTRITRIRHPRQVLRQAGALTGQQRDITGRQILKLLQGRTDQGQ
jgi:hypothetical protein